MNSAQIQQLLLPPDRKSSEDAAIAFLDSRFTSLDDLNSPAFDVALQESQSRSKELHSVLAKSRASVDTLIVESKAKASEYLTSAQELSLLRYSVADEITSLSDELISVTSPDSEPTLLEEVETLHRRLKELESVKAYVKIVHRAVQLSEQAVEAVKQLKASYSLSESTLSDYKLLQSLAASVGSACEDADDGTGQGVYITSFISDILDRTWLSIKDVLFETILSAAEKLQWPMPVDYAAASATDREQFQKAFLSLITLQELGDKIHTGKHVHLHVNRQTDGLYALEALIRPVAQRFKYHFDGTRQTNRLDKPEWYFAHILNLAYEHRRFMDTIIQRLVQTSSYKSINAWCEFTRLLLPILTRKLRRSVPQILSHPPLLAHTVYQCLAFDDALREADFSLTGTFASSDPSSKTADWEGTSEIILGSKEWFESWLAGERKFVEAQYDELIVAPDAWQLVDDNGDNDVKDRDLRPTNSARRIKALIEQVTDRYKVLPRPLHRTRFLIAVQIPIMERYHTRISESLDAFESISSYFTRAIPGALAGQSGDGQDSRRLTTGVEGSQRLVKAFVSAKWLATTMAMWGEDMFFLELWQLIREDPEMRTRAEDVKSLPNPNDVRDEGTIFGKLVMQYDALADRGETMIVKQICGEVEADLRFHLFKDPSTGQDTGDTIISQTLLAPIARLSSHLALLYNSLPTNITVPLYRKIATHISTHILQRQVLYRGRGRLSSQDGKVILDEAKIWVETCRMAANGTIRRADGPWGQLVEAGKLLSLEGAAFNSAAKVAAVGSDVDYGKLAEDLGIDGLSRKEVEDVLKAREDYSK